MKEKKWGKLPDLLLRGGGGEELVREKKNSTQTRKEIDRCFAGKEKIKKTRKSGERAGALKKQDYQGKGTQIIEIPVLT